ncbi:toxin TcdB middle/N-terminal domain-containing protein, partial [Chryseobacterium hagamense]|uniref:toxin TcdB middle/N-terminal domain-containing protein n=1 Tax=Chryseobacterium hagamense TaxID=395935 RepID=UPI0011BD5349
MSSIDVSYKSPGSNNGIRKYFFEYYTGPFYKTLLSKITAPGVTYQLDYHDDTSGTIFGPDKTVNTPAPDAFSGAVNSVLSPSKISADNSLEWGWSVRAGGGFALFKPHRSGDKNFMISGFFGESYLDSKRAIELIDFNGDGVADILYRKRNGDNGIKLIPGNLDPNGNLQFSSPQQNVLNLKSNFSHTTGSTWTNGATVLFNWWKMGFDFTKSWSRTRTNTPVYLIDANSDGLPDVVKDDKVWFNRISTNGQPEMVTTSDLTENMVIKGNIPAPYTEPEEEDDAEDEAARGKNDVVKVWIAPKTGYIKISDVISMADPVKEAVAVYSIEILNPTDLPKNGRLYLKKLIGTNPPVSVNIEHYNDYNGIPLGINTSDRILVKSGEKVYFRLHKKKGLNYVVNTSPTVTYTDDNGSAIADTPEEEQDGFQPNALKYEEKFFLNNLTKTLAFQSYGSGQIDIPGFTVPHLNDEVTYKITLSKNDIADPATDIQVLYSKTYGQSTGPVAIDPVNLNFSAFPLVESQLKFIVETDSYVNKNLEWKDIHVTNNGTGTVETHDIAIYPSYFVSDMKSKFHVADLSNVPQGTNFYAISINKTGSFTPSVTGSFMYAIKKNGLVVEKRKVEIKPSGIFEYTLFGAAIPSLSPIAFYNGDPSQPVQLSDKINILVFCATPQDRAAYESLRSQLQGKAFNIYYGSSNQFAGSTTETSVNTSEFNAISAVYHNWGQFIYNEARDIKKGDNPLDPPYNDPKDGPTGPTPSNGPDYVPNPNTPKDQYGALINSEFLDSPFGNFNHNFNSCAGITNADDYANCVGDILQADFQNMANTNILAGMSPVIPLIVYNLKKDNKFIQKWVNGMFTEQYSMASSFRDEESMTPFFVSDDPDEPDTEVQGNDNTAMYAIEKRQKSKSKTTNFGIGIPVISTSASQLRDYGNINTQDFFDVNGDGYPDMLYRTQAQLTNSLGGLLGVQPNLENNGDSPISSADSFQRTNTIAFTNTAVKTVARMISNKNADAKGDESSPWSGGLGFSNYPNSYDKGLKFWADINGDGLVDRVDKIGNEFKYRLNYGTGLTSYENFTGLDTYNSKPVGAASVSIGGGLSGLISQTSTFSSGFGISGNLTASSSTGTSKKTFQDVNGDGLADIVSVEDNGNANVSYNMGNKFAAPEALSKQGAIVNYANESRNYNGAFSLNVGYYLNIPTITLFGITILYLRAGIDANANLGLTISEVNKALRDINGDGFPDLVVNTGSGLQVNYSRIGRTNKLSKVTELKSRGSFTIDYEFSRPSYEDPHAKLVMREVKILNPDVNSDTYTQSTAGKDQVIRFKYDKSRYDRRERTSYGFATVTSEEMNGTSVYRQTVQTFYNSTYFNNGLEQKTEVFANGTLSSSTVKNFKLYNYNSNHTQISEIPAAQFETYDVGGTQGNRTALVKLTGTGTTRIEGGVALTTSDVMSYNDKGQLINYQYNSNVASGNYSSEISYHNYPSLTAANILDIPAD